VCGTDAEPSAPDGVDGSVSGAQEPVVSSPPEVSLDFDTCEGFLGDPAPDLVSKSFELTEPANNDNHAVETACMVSHQTADGSKAITLAVTKFDSTGAADLQYESTRGGLELDDPPPGAQFNDAVDGAQSFQAVTNSGGVGSLVVIRKELVIISLYTAMPSDKLRYSIPGSCSRWPKVSARSCLSRDAGSL